MDLPATRVYLDRLFSPLGVEDLHNLLSLLCICQKKTVGPLSGASDCSAVPRPPGRPRTGRKESKHDMFARS